VGGTLVDLLVLWANLQTSKFQSFKVSKFQSELIFKVSKVQSFLEFDLKLQSSEGKEFQSKEFQSFKVKNFKVSKFHNEPVKGLKRLNLEKASALNG
jgi:hypothetical protein